jgi:adenine-specific DNA methylase
MGARVVRATCDGGRAVRRSGDAEQGEEHRHQRLGGGWNSFCDGHWDPAADKRLTVWEITQHLISALETDGESGAAALLRKVGALGDVARDLAYRLYGICERKKWAQEALAYNSLVIAWPEIVKLAAQTQVSTQEELF